MMFLGLDQETGNRLRQLANDMGCSKRELATIAIREYLDDREDYVIGIAALESNESRISLEELERDLLQGG